MIAFTPDGFAAPMTVACEHGLLHGELSMLPESAGLVVVSHAGPALDAREAVLAGILRHAGLSTLTVELTAREEAHFPDLHNNVSLLAKRLLDFLGAIKNRMLTGELPAQPLGLCAAEASSPVAVRTAALRDHDIAAIVCRGGLIDLAGMLYLRSLAAPLLMLVEENDAQHVASSRRAFQEVPGRKELKLIPEIGIDFAASAGFAIAARETAQWFGKHLKPV